MPNSRVADSTIKGFIYQFNKTILEILDSPKATIHVEGIVEDVDKYEADNSITAIQCKYHESSEKFILSLIYKPIILMIKTFLMRPHDNISFVLFINLLFLWRAACHSRNFYSFCCWKIFISFY